jgi:uncharacterized integral membrane protein
VTVAPQPQAEAAPRQPAMHLATSGTPETPSGRTRTSAAWIGIVAAALVLVLLLIFILQNMRSVKVTFLGASGTIPVGIALLFAAVGGLLLAGLVGSLRIWQLHHRITKAGRGAPEPAQEPTP